MMEKSIFHGDKNKISNPFVMVVLQKAVQPILWITRIGVICFGIGNGK